jgi:hypothetical protein
LPEDSQEDARENDPAFESDQSRVDIDLIAVYRRTGIGKTTLAVGLALQYSVLHDHAPIWTNVPLKIPGIEVTVVEKVSELLDPKCTAEPCICEPKIILLDEFDKSFSSQVDWLSKQRDQMLTQLIANARKHGVIAMIATSQLRKKIRNTYRGNCKYVCEPIGELDTAGCPEYFLWDDVDVYESARRYESAVLLSLDIPLKFLSKTFNTRKIVPVAWE